MTGTEPSFLLHPLDVIGGEQAPELKFFPGMDVPMRARPTFLLEVLEILQEHFRLVHDGRARPRALTSKQARRHNGARPHPCAPSTRADPMCGLVGIICRDGSQPELALLREMGGLIRIAGRTRRGTS